MLCVNLVGLGQSWRVMVRSKIKCSCFYSLFRWVKLLTGEGVGLFVPFEIW